MSEIADLERRVAALEKPKCGTWASWSIALQKIRADHGRDGSRAAVLAM
jgi:hypothetical protein